MSTVKKTISNQLRTGHCSVRTIALLGVCISLLVGCSAGGNDDRIGNNGPAGNGTVGSATILPSVKMVDLSQADYVAAQTATTWTLRTASSVKAGDVLLLKDAAVKVVSVDTSNDQVVLTVDPTEIQDVFSKLSLSLTFDQNDAEFLPDPSNDIQATFTPNSTGNNIAAPISGSVSKVLTFPYNAPPFSASLSFKFLGDANLDYDSSSSAGITGALALTGILEGNISMIANKAINPPRILAEKSIGILRIPVSISVTDSLLRRIGIYTASIYVPISVGAEVGASVAVGAKINGTAQSTIVTTYDATNGFMTAGPTNTASLSITGIPSSNVPNSVVHGSLMAGPFIHALPQLLILNKVASIGADTKIGLYGKGQVTSILSAPYYCLDLQGMVRGTAFGFFKTITGTKLETDPISKSQDVGPRFVYPDSGCSPTMQFDAASYSATTTAGSATITVTRTGDPSATASVQYATNNGTAVAGRDYTAVSGTLTFNPTDTAKTFTIPILSDPTNQGGTVNLMLSQPNKGTVLGTPNTAVLTITPSKSMQFSQSTFSVNATLGLTTIAVTRTGDLSEAATVQYATNNGTAVAGRDYTAVSGTLTFAQFDGAQSFDIPIPTTSLGGTVNLSLSQPSAGTRLGTPSTAVLTIQSSIPGVHVAFSPGVMCGESGVLKEILNGAEGSEDLTYGAGGVFRLRWSITPNQLTGTFICNDLINGGSGSFSDTGTGSMTAIWTGTNYQGTYTVPHGSGSVTATVELPQ